MIDWLADTFLARSLLRCIDDIRARNPLYWCGGGYRGSTRFRMQKMGASRARGWQGCLCAIETDGLHLYPATRKWDMHIHLERETLRWFGRPEAYHPGINDLWIHVEHDEGWHLLMLRTSQYAMQHFVRAMKQIATPEQITAYRRQRPYIHLGPIAAQRAEEDLYGVWTVDPQVRLLYLMPSTLIELEGERVLRMLPLEAIQGIEVMQRRDVASADGIVRFRHIGGGERGQIAYTTPAFVAFAEALITACKRWLEQPPIIYGKKGDEDDMA
jgi:hypothetical protein